jgi:hypothetical protein
MNTPSAQTELVALIIKDRLPWEAIESDGTPVTIQPVKDLETLLRCHKSGIHVRASHTVGTPLEITVERPTGRVLSPENVKVTFVEAPVGE